MAACAAALLVLAVIPVDPRLAVGRLDKAAHLGQYLLFAWLLAQAIRSHRLKERDYLWLAWIFAASYGMLIELLQALVPWRSADWADALVNAAGAALGVWLGHSLPRSS